jgi:putative ABC transport system substrate-binding protein
MCSSVARRGLIVALAARHGVPTIYERRDFPDSGGLISYGHQRADAYRQLGIYTGRILKCARPQPPKNPAAALAKCPN